MNGIDALHHIKDLYPDILVIMITAYEDVDTVISAMKREPSVAPALPARKGSSKRPPTEPFFWMKWVTLAWKPRPSCCGFWNSVNFIGISSDVEILLISHNWTGHVRELKNLIEIEVLIGKEPELSPSDLGLDPKNQRQQQSTISGKAGFPPLPPEGIILDAQLQSLEKHYIEEALKISKGNESKAAKLLNINHHTFRYRKKKLFGE
jgi:DNA-binding NtrC family response regulator